MLHRSGLILAIAEVGILSFQAFILSVANARIGGILTDQYYLEGLFALRICAQVSLSTP